MEPSLKAANPAYENLNILNTALVTEGPRSEASP